MLLKSQKGTALFVAIMMLVLSTGLGLLALRVSVTELQISSYAKNDLSSSYLAESGIEKVLSWIFSPVASPDPIFFESLGPLHQARCIGNRAAPDFHLSSAILNDMASGPFSELKEMGKILDLRLYRGDHSKGLCVVEVKAESGGGAIKTIRVELTKSPVQPMTAGIQGAGNADVASPIWAHWGKIRYTGSVNLGSSVQKIPAKNSSMPPNAAPYVESGLNQDPWMEIQVEKQVGGPLPDHLNGENQPYADRPNVYENESTVKLDPVDFNELKNYTKMYGEYYLVSPIGHLEQNGIDKGTFDQLFHPPATDHRLIWIDLLPGYSSLEPIVIGQSNYKGYFYFTGNVQIEGGRPGEKVHAESPPWPSSTPQQIELADINLDGFFYVLGELTLQHSFLTYGSLFAGKGFTGAGANQLEVWYNNQHHSANYSDLPPVTRLKGTWRTLNLGLE
jgi:hypothetical protein